MVIDPIYRDALIFSNLLTLLSIGLTLTYLTTRVPNFAHGSFATRALPKVAETTFGASGWLKLNEAGDREIADYELGL